MDTGWPQSPLGPALLISRFESCCAADGINQRHGLFELRQPRAILDRWAPVDGA